MKKSIKINYRNYKKNILYKYQLKFLIKLLKLTQFDLKEKVKSNIVSTLFKMSNKHIISQNKAKRLVKKYCFK